MGKKEKVLICGILPPPYFGHSMLYKVLMETEFKNAFDLKFLNLHFWTYESHKKVTVKKLWKMVKYLVRYIYLLCSHRPKYVLYNMSFDRIPFLKDYLFCGIGKIFGCKIIIHDHGQYVKELYDGSGVLYKKLVKNFCRMATSSIVLGERTKTVYQGFMDQSKLIVVPGSVSDHKAMFCNGKKATSNSGYVKVLYFSYVSRTKGILTALKAVKKIVEKNTRIRFTFGGPFESEELKAEIMKFVDENRLEPYVEFLGYVATDEERTRLLRSSDIFMFPTHRDVFGLVLLHAMAEELAIVASDEGAIPEIIENGVNGFLFPKGDEVQLAEKVLMLADSSELRQKMGKANRQKYLNVYTPKDYGRNMIKAFEDISQLVS